jgi:hypothetical protein
MDELAEAGAPPAKPNETTERRLLSMQRQNNFKGFACLARRMIDRISKASFPAIKSETWRRKRCMQNKEYNGKI